MCEQAHGGPGHSHDAGLPENARPDEFRVVLTGKGGVGKTSLTALLGRLLARQAYRVLALDADPQMNLPYALGMPHQQARSLVPLSHNQDYIEEKTGARPGSGWGLFFRLNPDVDDVVRRFGVVAPDGVRLLVMGDTVQPAAGCLCPENTLLAAVANNLSLRHREVILLDTQAGVEHFGRALARGFRHAVVITDPSFNGVQVALQSARLANELGIPMLHLVVNRVRNEQEMDRVTQILNCEDHPAFATQHILPWDERLLACEPDVGPLLDDASSPLLASAAELRDALLYEESLRCRRAS